MLRSVLTRTSSAVAKTTPAASKAAAVTAAASAAPATSSSGSSSSSTKTMSSSSSMSSASTTTTTGSSSNSAPSIVAAGRPDTTYYSELAQTRGDARLPLSSDLVPGAKVGPGGAWTVTAREELEDLNLTAIGLTHSRTGAQHVHLDSADTNNVFAVAFRTLPDSSNGAPHILEHVTLCGSKAFPVRDPFFNMLTRSLSTYMNAWTGADWTMYPFATQNPNDYANLMEVYMDAVFRPRLHELDFAQEGWRYEFNDPSDPSSGLTYKGVVYNEMKGALSDPGALYGTRLCQALFADSPVYSVVSGGDPVDIPSLTIEQLRDFHKVHYHPSNAIFFTFGDLPLEHHLGMTSKALDEFEPLPSVPSVQPIPGRWASPRAATVVGPPDTMTEGDGSSRVSRSWLLHDSTDPYEGFVWSLISALLVDGPAAPLYQALLEQEPVLGARFSPGTGFDPSSRDTMFSVGLQGVNPDNTKTVLERIDSAIHSTLAEGFPMSRVEAWLHQIELSRKTSSSGPFGLAVISAITPFMLHGGSLRDALDLDSRIQRLRGELAAAPDSAPTKPLTDRIAKTLLHNSHVLDFTMHADETYLQGLEKDEAATLASSTSGLTEEQARAIVSNAAELQKTQNEEQDLSVLPSLTLGDIPVQAPYQVHPEYSTTGAGMPIIWSTVPTRGVTYLRFKTPSHQFASPEELTDLYLLTALMGETGAGSMDHRDYSMALEATTGGFGVSTALVSPLASLDAFSSWTVGRSHALHRNVQPMLDLVGDAWLGARWNDSELVSNLVRQTASGMSDSVVSSGHRFAKAHASSALSTFLAQAEDFSGLSQIDRINKLANDPAALAALPERLAALHASLVTTPGFAVHVKTDGTNRAELEAALEEWSARLASAGVVFGTPEEAWRSPATGQVSNEAWPGRQDSGTYFRLPVQVGYAGMATPSGPYSHRDTAVASVLARLMTTNFLHREIREKGGAYGGGAAVDDSGSFGWYSYRDPSPEASLATFEESLAWVGRPGSFDDDAIDQAKLSVFSGLDSPVSPAVHGNGEFMRASSNEIRQARRASLLSVGREDLLRLAESLAAQPKSSTVIGTEEGADSFRSRDGWSVVDP